MHNHSVQLNPNLQLDALSAAQKAAATQQAAETRRKLLDGATKLRDGAEAGEDYVVKLSRRQDSQGHSERESAETPNAGTAAGNAVKDEAAQSGSDDAEARLSAWA